MNICFVCGCTDMNCRNCIEKTGEPSWWVNEEKTLCSTCFYLEENEKEFENILSENFSSDKYFDSIKEEFYLIRERMKTHQNFNTAEPIEQLRICLSIARLMQEKQGQFINRIQSFKKNKTMFLKELEYVNN